MFVRACKCRNYALCSILLKNFPTSDNILSFSLDTKVSNLVQIEVENLHILFF